MFRAKDFDLDVSQLKSDKGRKLLYEHNIYVRPCEKILPNGSKAYYVPLRQLLANLLRHPEAAEYLLRPISSLVTAASEVLVMGRDFAVMHCSKRKGMHSDY